MKKILLALILLIFSGHDSFAQDGFGTVSGTVTTLEGQPLEAVNVVLKGTKLGARTTVDGAYEIKRVPPGTYTLAVSIIGFAITEAEVMVHAGATTAVSQIALAERLEQMEEVVVFGERINKYNRIASVHVAKLPLRNIENPQSYSIISLELLKDQAITNFDDALKNAPGIDKLWEATGRGYGDGAAYYSLRGFETQATIVNGLPGLTNGSLDPANIERIEVIKGPSGTLYGSSLISYGGLVNTVTKRPYQGFGGEASYISGSFGLNRVTADINTPLSRNKDITLRINAAYHSENSFQDAGFKKSLFLAPSLSYKASERLAFLINTEFIEAEATNPTMLFLNRYGPLLYKNLNDLNYNNQLSLTSNDLAIKNPRYNLQGEMTYRFSDQWFSQTVLARGSAGSDGYYSYLWDNATGDFSLYISDQNAKTITTDFQQNFIGDFKIRGLRHRVILGFDYFNRSVMDNSTGYPWLHNVTPQGEINYIDPFTGDTLAPRYLSRQSVDALLQTSERSNSTVKSAAYSAYVSDVITLTSRLSAMASLRLDYFDSEGDVTTDEDDFDQTALSPKFGLVFQPWREKLSLFANYMNGFKNVAPAQVAEVDGSNPRIKTFEPEHANQMELGVKANPFGGRLSATLSYYDILVTNRVMSDPENVYNSIQGGEVESKGFELDLTANPAPGLNLILGYSYNDTKVLKADGSSIWAVVGRRPVDAGAENLFNAWATYRFTQGSLKGFGLGLGLNAASELLVLDSELTGRFALPSYTLLNASLYYDAADYRISLHVNNATDEEYYKGYSTINPQRPRNFSASYSYKF